MHIIKLDATGSTNAVLKELWQDGQAKDWTVVWADYQHSGRGQKGTVWQSEPGKNLTFSVLKSFKNFDIQDQFLLNMAVSMAVFEALDSLGIPDLKLKWPNDILSGSRKICGILIENMVKASRVTAAIIGIGINVNQMEFGELKEAASLRSITGKDYELESLLNSNIGHLQTRLDDFKPLSRKKITREYHSILYRKDMVSSFIFPNGKKANGIIRGISERGELLVETEADTRSFSMKEIQLLN